MSFTTYSYFRHPFGKIALIVYNFTNLTKFITTDFYCDKYRIDMLDIYKNDRFHLQSVYKYHKYLHKNHLIVIANMRQPIWRFKYILDEVDIHLDYSDIRTMVSCPHLGELIDMDSYMLKAWMRDLL